MREMVYPESKNEEAELAAKRKREAEVREEQGTESKRSGTKTTPRRHFPLWIATLLQLGAERYFNAGEGAKAV